jgi:hypothetical protein
MPISKTPEITIYPSGATNESEPRVERFNSIPTPADLKSGMLFGIPLKSAITQEELSDEAIQQFIDEAISEIEHTLDLYITPVTFEEKHDYLRQAFTWSYNYLKLNHPNICSVEKVELSFSNESGEENKGFVQFPLEHVHVMPQEGTIQLVPAFGTSLSGFLLSAFSGTQFHALRAIGLSNFPGGVRIRYTAGFKHNKLPAILSGLIQTMAAIRTLSLIGPLLFPHNSTSISIDGTSQSTSNPGPAYLKQRMDELENQKNQQMEAAKGYYQRRFLMDWF